MNKKHSQKVRRKIVATVGTAAIVLSLTGAHTATAAQGNDSSPDQSNQSVAGTIDETVLPSGSEVLTYVPDGIQLNSWNTPILLVMDEQDFTVDSAQHFAESSGLAANAQKDNAVISFVNPINDEWGETDLLAFDEIINRLYIERPSPSSWSNGRADGPENGRSDAYPTIYAGYPHRIGIVANGSAADFVSSYLVDDQLSLSMAPPPASWLPASVMLFNTTVLPSAEYREWPATIINGSPAVNEKYRSLNRYEHRFTVAQSDIADSFDHALVSEYYSSLTGVRRQQLLVGPASLSPETNATNIVVLDIVDYEELGVAPTQIDLTLSGDREAMYLAYVPETVVDNDDGTVPLVMLFHGSGERADWITMHAGWPELAAREDFIVVSVDDHGGQRTPGAMTTDQIAELMEDVFQRYPNIDRNRVYASGFSMGSMRTFTLGTQRPDLFAAVAPMHIMASPVDTNDDLILPIMYLVGVNDPFPNALPSHTSAQYSGEENAADQMLNHLFNVNDIRDGSYSYDADSPSIPWGITFDDTETIPATVGNSVFTINSLQSTDGNVYTKLVDISNLNHNTFIDQAPIAWDFMKQFSRNTDGTVSIDGEAEEEGDDSAPGGDENDTDVPGGTDSDDGADDDAEEDPTDGKAPAENPDDSLATTGGTAPWFLVLAALVLTLLGAASIVKTKLLPRRQN